MANEKRLIELMRSFENKHNSVVPDKEGLAEHLIANDVVPVVRCKDCKRYSQSGLCNLYLNVSHEMKPDDFCSYGERRTDV